MSWRLCGCGGRRVGMEGTERGKRGALAVFFVGCGREAGKGLKRGHSSKYGAFVGLYVRACAFVYTRMRVQVGVGTISVASPPWFAPGWRC